MSRPGPSHAVALTPVTYCFLPHVSSSAVTQRYGAAFPASSLSVAYTESRPYLSSLTKVEHTELNTLGSMQHQSL